MGETIRLSRLVEQGGCSAKLSPDELERVLKSVPLPSHPDLIVGPETHDDAGVFRLPEGRYLIQTVDFFPPMVDDPFTFGQVAAANALSDVYAMAGVPLTALCLMMFPSRELPTEILAEVLRGGFAKAQEAGALILGGHTLDDSPLKFGMAVTGTVEAAQLATNAAAKPGEVLILTKPLGTAVLTGARKVDLINEEAVQPAIDSMTRLNDTAALCLRQFDLHAATDITGFSLLGHALRFAQASHATFRLDTSRLPLLPGALDLVKMGAIPGGAMRNLKFVAPHSDFLPSLTSERKYLAADPQTSGGLLFSAPESKVDAVLRFLREHGIAEAAVFGEVLPRGEKTLLVA
ncbi:MAG: selenide, water dikinase SelD [Myxococcales bacterium]|nr:MAG: selenide, water dikinase SelD [Myxococcales bacterium]